MKASLSILLLLAASCLGFAQTAPPAAQKAPLKGTAPAAPPAKSVTPVNPAAQPQANPAPAAAEVAPEAAVITLEGVCKAKPANPADCKTLVTRAEFEKLIGVLNPNPKQAIPPSAKRQFAMQYARMLLFATEAEKQNLENRPDMQELFRFAHMQALAQGLTRAMQEKSQPTPEELQKFYEQNKPRFHELTFDRIMVPVKPAGAEKTNEAEMRKVTDDLHQRAASGADFKTLQAEAFQKAGMQNPPETRMVLQPDALPENQKSVAQLKPGEVSSVIADPTGFYIYKLVSEQTVPFEKVKDELQTSLAQQKMQQAMESILGSTTPNLNPAYFGPGAPMPGGFGIRPAPGTPQNPPATPPSPK